MIEARPVDGEGRPLERRKRQAYLTKPDETKPFPTEVETPGLCPFDGRTLPPPFRESQPKRFCNNRCKSNWHDWRKKLAAKRIAEAADVIERELPILHRG